MALGKWECDVFNSNTQRCFCPKRIVVWKPKQNVQNCSAERWELHEISRIEHENWGWSARGRSSDQLEHQGVHLGLSLLHIKSHTWGWSKKIAKRDCCLETKTECTEDESYARIFSRSAAQAWVLLPRMICSSLGLGGDLTSCKAAWSRSTRSNVCRNHIHGILWRIGVIECHAFSSS